LNDWIKEAYDKEEEAKRPEAAEESSTRGLCES